MGSEMAEEHRLILTLVPKVDTEALQGAISGTTGTSGAHQQGAATQNATGGGSTGGPTGGGGGSTPVPTGGGGTGASPTGGVSGDAVADADKQAELHGIARISSFLKRGIKGLSSDSEDDDDKDDKRQELKKKLITSSVEAGTSAFKSIAQTSLGIVEDIYKQMKNASPLLQAIESMFNLAVTLFFMPLGNKLGELLIPATMDLLDQVTEIWDSFEGKTLGEAVAWAIEKGTKIFAGYIRDIAGTLEGQEGIVGSMAKFLNTIADFVDNKLEGLLDGLLNFAGWILENFKHFIALYVSMSTAQLGATIMASLGPAGGLIGAIAGGGIGFGSTYAVLSQFGLAEGGKVPATEGGQWRLLGEGGEDEYVIPESKMDQVFGGGSITNNWYIQCNTTEDIVELIDDRISRQISRSKIQSGF